MPRDIQRAQNLTTKAIVTKSAKYCYNGISCPISSSHNVTWHLIPLRYSYILVVLLVLFWRPFLQCDFLPGINCPCIYSIQTYTITIRLPLCIFINLCIFECMILAMLSGGAPRLGNWKCNWEGNIFHVTDKTPDSVFILLFSFKFLWDEFHVAVNTSQVMIWDTKSFLANRFHSTSTEELLIIS